MDGLIEALELVPVPDDIPGEDAPGPGFDEL
jgi:hypothetical protein